MADLLAQLQAALGDRYTVERELGRGGMAVVYLARDLKHDRQVALKVLRPELAASIGTDRFLREIRIAAKLTHPNILMLIDSGEADGLLYYVMPYLEGESLADRLVRERQLPIEDALQITREVADALSHAHSQGVIHRDIKPENILFEGGHAVVTDFGIARAVSAAGGEKLTETGLAVGTPAYMSPEQAMGTGETDARADVYSLACVLYEMLGGDTPFPGTTPQAILARKVSEPAPPLRTLRDTVAVPLEGVVLKALARSPADRYTTATRFAEAWASAATGPVSGAAVAPVPATRRRAARWAGYAAGAVLLVLLAVLVLPRVPGWPSGAAAAEPTWIMVKPFAYLGPEDQAYLAAGLVEDVRTRLGGVGALRVIARQTSMHYKDSEKTVQQIGDEVGVRYILDGTVRGEQAADGASQLRLTVGLASTADGVEVWSAPYDDLTRAARRRPQVGGMTAGE